MEFAKTTDFGTAPEFMVDGLGTAKIIGNTVRLSFFAQFGDERRVILHVRWDRSTYLRAIADYRVVREQIIGRLPAEFPSTRGSTQ